MFINIATENIIVQDNKSLCMIPFAGVEKELSRVVVSSYKTYLPDYIYVLNGPGSFTNLRVGSLVINTLILLSQGSHHHPSLHSIDKLSLYKSLYLVGGLPRYGYIFMGQRKNVRYYDFEQDTYLTYAKGELSSMDLDTYHGQDVDFFVDMFVGKDFEEYFAGHHRMIDIFYNHKEVFLSFVGKEHIVTHLFVSIQKMEPHYAMEPNIG